MNAMKATVKDLQENREGKRKQSSSPDWGQTAGLKRQKTAPLSPAQQTESEPTASTSSDDPDITDTMRQLVQDLGETNEEEIEAEEDSSNE